MPLIETESLVLRTYNLAEADKIVVFFTRDHGLVRGVAKGAKRLKSRFGSTLEPFSIVQLGYFQKEDRELVSIQNVEMISSAFEKAADPAFLATFSYIADLLTAFVPPGDPNERLHRMVTACLAAAKAQPDALAALRLYFEVWLLRLSGYAPDWDRCEKCGRRLEVVEVGGLQPNYQLRCASCASARGQEISSREREVYRIVQSTPPTQFAVSAVADSQEAAAVSQIMRRIISGVIGHEIGLVATGAGTAK